MYTKRFIEETFPVKEISELSAKEKNIRHGHISTLHIWWARRPLAASRSTAFAALIPYPEDEKTINYFWSVFNPLFNKGILPKARKTKNVVDAINTFIIEMARWENSNNKDIVKTAQQIILHFNENVPPKVLDPFGGGGSIPLECMRIGCETYSNDLNPVAILIQKCTLEFPQKYGKPGYVEREVKEIEKGEYVTKKKEIFVENVLLEDVKYWGKWILDEAQKELKRFYPPDPNGFIPVGYIWARTIPCQNPVCGIDIPLMRQFWLAKKANKKVALYPFLKNKKLEFKIVGDGYEKLPANFEPELGTIKRAVGLCPVCQSGIAAETVKKLLIKSPRKNEILAVVVEDQKTGQRKYRTKKDNDDKVFLESLEELNLIQTELKNKYSIEATPDEVLPLMSGVFNVPMYGLNTWGSLFNARQLLSIYVFIKHLRLINSLFSKDNPEYSKAIITYLALILSRQTSYNSTLCWWEPLGERSFNTFGRQALPMVFDHSEQTPYGPLTGSWPNQIEIVESILSFLQLNNNVAVNISQGDAISIVYDNIYFDAIFTDPPYYNSVPYADLSDYFYVWLKRSINFLYPDLFISELTPKNNEITEMAGWDKTRYAYKDKAFFENKLGLALKQIYFNLKKGGISIIVYAHKSTEGWETLINSLLDSNLIITGAWPLHTEMESRLTANESAALASSIYIVCRKIDRLPTAFYNDIKEELKKYLSHKLDSLWNQGIGGTDFFIAAIGSSIEVFGKYEKVIDFEGNVIRADRLLTDVRIFVTDYAVKKILHNGFASGISDLTRFYVLCRWEFKAAKIPFDEANKLSHSCHIELAELWQTKSFVKKDKEFVQILGPQDRDIEDIEDSGELIDVLHYAIKLWEKGNKAEMQKVLNESGYAKSDAFFRVAQAIAETLPNENEAKKLLVGFLNLRVRILNGFKVMEDTVK